MRPAGQVRVTVRNVAPRSRVYHTETLSRAELRELTAAASFAVTTHAIMDDRRRRVAQRAVRILYRLIAAAEAE